MMRNTAEIISDVSNFRLLYDHVTDNCTDRASAVETLMSWYALINTKLQLYEDIDASQDG